MALEDLVEEIRRRGEAELEKIRTTRAATESQLLKEREQKVAEVRSGTTHAAETEAARERAQRIAAAKLKSRKLLYEAREQRLRSAVDETRKLLASFTSSGGYDDVLKGMVDSATRSLGKQVRVSGRTEDASRLSKIAGKAFDPTPQAILGGIIVETVDGARRLNLSFDELLRLREDRVRELLA